MAPRRRPERIDGKLTLWGKFAQHRRDARWRKIPFELTFYEWCTIWEESGFLSQRGVFKGQYVMARPGDKGPYAVGNVVIMLCEQNHHEANIGVPRPKSAEHCKKISEGHKGKKFSEAHKKSIGDALRGKPRPPFTEEWKRNLSEGRKRMLREKKALEGS